MATPVTLNVSDALRLVQHLAHHGSMIETVFALCVGVLQVGAVMLGTSYEAINVWIFCVIWPVIMLGLMALVLAQRRTIRRLRRGQL